MQQNKEENYKVCTSRCRILLVRRKRKNIMHDSVFLHTAKVGEEIHLVCLLLVFLLHLLPLNGKPNLHLLLLSRQTRLQIL